jgi:Ti-type conjugative transfer relaxase TraA
MYHLRAKIIGRSGGRSAAGAVAYRVGSRSGAAVMAYRAGEKLRDPQTGQSFDYSRKARLDAEGFGILHSEIVLPTGAPDWMRDRQALIDAVEASEKRVDAQLFREIELSLPRELTLERQIELVRAFVQSAFVSTGMAADFAIHDERASDGGRNPHAHILLTMREIGPHGFGRKVRAWNNPAMLREWREAWAEMANEKLAELGFERRLDHRSHRERGIQIEPDIYVGPRAKRSFDGVIATVRAEQRAEVREENVRRISGKPEILLDAVTREKATFTAADIGYALRRATGLSAEDPDHDRLLAAALASPELVAIASDQRGATRYATRTMIRCEGEMARAAASLAGRNSAKIARAAAPVGLSVEQQRAWAHIVCGPDLTLVSGVAGAGKTTTLRAVADTLRAAGHRVRGASLAAIAAKKLGDEADIPASTLASLFYGWDRKNADGVPSPIGALERGDVLVVDEAGMVESRDMRRLLAEAQGAGARVVLVGDARQLQAIGPGAAFRALLDTHGAAELNDVRRQSAEWMREATVAMHAGRMEEALQSYEAAGAVHRAESTPEAMDALITRWIHDRAQGHSQFILTYYSADVEALNARARAALRLRGQLGPDIRVQVQKQIRDGDGNVQQRACYRTFAEGDRILFTRNDRALGVQNGALGDVLNLDASGAFKVRLDDGNVITFNAADYGHLAQGYATTIHKAQSLTVDRAYVLASDRFNAQLAYVALSRHRHSVSLHYGRDQFPQRGDLARVCSRQRVKDSTLDYLHAYLAQSRTRQSQGRTDTTPPSAPMSAADRVRANAARRRARGRERGRERSLDE